MAISADNSGSLKGIAGSTSLEILKSSAKLRLLTARIPVGLHQSGWVKALQVLRWGDVDPS